MDCEIDFWIAGRETSRFYAYAIAVAVLPWISACALNVFWKIRKAPNAKFSISLIVLLFLFHTLFLTTSLGFFSCVVPTLADGTLGNLNFTSLEADASIVCWSPGHKIWALGFGLPMFLLYGIGIPSVALVYMRRKNKKYDQQRFNRAFGFLMAPYRKEMWYWDVVIMFRKLGMTVAAVLFRQWGIDVQIQTALLVLFLSVLAQMKKRPFSKPTMNQLEILSLCIAVITLACGNYMFSFSRLEKQENKGLPSFSGAFLSVLIISMNGGFFCLLVREFFKATKDLQKQIALALPKI